MTTTVNSYHEKYSFILMSSALLCIVVGIALGALSALYYVPTIAVYLKSINLSLAKLRPIHTTFVSAWIFLGGLAMVHRYLLKTYGPFNRCERFLFKGQMFLWIIAGLGILISLFMGFTSGREYIGYLPIFSFFILFGWIFYAANFIGRVARGFWDKPVYVYMWMVSVFYFIYTFIEAHAFLLPFISEYPVVDLQIQWKSYGSLVASFNLLVYGSLIYLAEEISCCKKYGQSRLAFALFGVGLLNSFTNYAHHTYHVPQNHLIKWIAFIVSSMEIIILAKILIDVSHMLMQRNCFKTTKTHEYFINLTKCWTFGMLCVAILISLPPINTLIHGTHVITAHAMGSEIGIDSYILFAVFSFMLTEMFFNNQKAMDILNGVTIKRVVRIMNLLVLVLVSWLFLSGTAVGVFRFLNEKAPQFTTWTPYVLAVCGFLLAITFGKFLFLWFRVIKMGLYRLSSMG